MPVKHTFVNILPDDPSHPELTRPSDWNANHDLSTLVASDVTDFNTAASAAAPVQSVNGMTGDVVISGESPAGSNTEIQYNNGGSFEFESVEE